MIAEVMARLIDQVPALKLVGGAAEFQAAAANNPTATPCAYVFLFAENPAPSATDQVIQRVPAAIAVIYAVRNVADPKGAAAQADMDTIRAAGKTALLGWQPEAGCDPIERGRGNLLAFRDGHMWWQDIYNTVYFDKGL